MKTFAFVKTKCGKLEQMKIDALNASHVTSNSLYEYLKGAKKIGRTMQNKQTTNKSNTAKVCKCDTVFFSGLRLTREHKQKTRAHTHSTVFIQLR